MQFNPARIRSTAAAVDAKSIAERPCFLCAKNRCPEQLHRDICASLEVLVNPFPVLPGHLTIVTKKHTPQLIEPMFADMLFLARRWRGMAVFYNGAKCGASAPDHAHLQAVRVSDIPLLGEQWSSVVADTMQPVLMHPSGAVFCVTGYVVPLFMVVAKEVSSSVELMSRVVAALPANGDEEPPVNVIVHYTAAEGYITIIVPRAKHRPDCYFATGDAQRLVSPGTLDIAGLVITPRSEDFEKITSDEALAILQEVGVSESEVADICEKIAAQ
jgi:ATP adenylyltransferase/5',5'''-P-1,P-4-tetraphosphate phosphorylase II